MAQQQSHKIVGMITGKGKTKITCACGESSPRTTRAKADEWFNCHTPFGAFRRIFG
jgi:hypothetical protein